MGNDVLRALAIGNGLVVTGCGAVALMPYVALPLDIALGTIAVSTLGVTCWLAAFTAKAVRTARRDKA